MKDFLSLIGVLSLLFLAAAIFISDILLPIKSGRWLLDRFSYSITSGSIVLRHDDDRESAWICVDGTPNKPRSCLTSAELLYVAREFNSKKVQ